MGYGAGWFARKPAKNLYEITEENQQNKQSEIPQEDLKESLEEIKENIWKKTCQQAGLKTGQKHCAEWRNVSLQDGVCSILATLGWLHSLKICLHIWLNFTAVKRVDRVTEGDAKVAAGAWLYR